MFELVLRAIVGGNENGFDVHSIPLNVGNKFLQYDEPT